MSDVSNKWLPYLISVLASLLIATAGYGALQAQVAANSTAIREGKPIIERVPVIEERIAMVQHNIAEIKENMRDLKASQDQLLREFLKR